MKKIITLSILFLILNLNTFSQKIYDLSEIQQIPSIDSKNMEIITSSIYKLYQLVLQNPQKYSTDNSTKEIVYLYFSKGGKLVGSNPINGEIYKNEDYEKFIENNKILFNLNFDNSGQILLPQNFVFISYKEKILPSRQIIETNLYSFEIEINDSIRTEFSKARLEILAKANINSVTGGYSPVHIKLPLNMKLYKFNTPTISQGQGTILNDIINITYLNRNYKTSSEKQEIITLISNQTDILTYKKGTFLFEIEEIKTGYGASAEINISRSFSISKRSGFEISNLTVNIKNFNCNGTKKKK